MASGSMFCKIPFALGGFFFLQEVFLLMCLFFFFSRRIEAATDLGTIELLTILSHEGQRICFKLVD